MQIYRRFRIAPSLARLIRKERGINEQIAEGHFPSHPERGQYVSISREACFLVLRDTREGVDSESRTDLPRAQAEALMDICASKIAFGRTLLQTQGAKELSVDYFLKPGAFDIVTVAFDGPGQAAAFRAPMWLGPEVTQNATYEKRAIALEGLPKADYVPLSDAALNALLNVFEHVRPTIDETVREDAPVEQRSFAPAFLPVAEPLAPFTPPPPLPAEQVAATTLDQPEFHADEVVESDPMPAEQPVPHHELAAVASAPDEPQAEPARPEQGPLDSVIAGLSHALVGPDAPYPEARPSAVRSGWEIRRARPAIR